MQNHLSSGFPTKKPTLIIAVVPRVLLLLRYCRGFSVGWEPNHQLFKIKLTQSLWFYLHRVPHLTGRWHGWISRTKGLKRVLLGVLSAAPRISWKGWCQTAKFYADDLVTYSQRKSSSTLPLISTPALSPVKALSRNVSRLHPLIPGCQITWGKVQVQSRKQLWSSALPQFTRCLVGIQSSYCCSQGGPPRIKATKGLAV